jgi:hypothetical protein
MRHPCSADPQQLFNPPFGSIRADIRLECALQQRGPQRASQALQAVMSGRRRAGAVEHLVPAGPACTLETRPGLASRRSDLTGRGSLTTWIANRAATPATQDGPRWPAAGVRLALDSSASQPGASRPELLARNRTWNLEFRPAVPPLPCPGKALARTENRAGRVRASGKNAGPTTDRLLFHLAMAGALRALVHACLTRAVLGPRHPVPMDRASCRFRHSASA